MNRFLCYFQWKLWFRFFPLEGILLCGINFPENNVFYLDMLVWWCKWWVSKFQRIILFIQAHLAVSWISPVCFPSDVWVFQSLPFNHVDIWPKRASVREFFPVWTLIPSKNGTSVRALICTGQGRMLVCIIRSCMWFLCHHNTRPVSNQSHSF